MNKKFSKYKAMYFSPWGLIFITGFSVFISLAIYGSVIMFMTSRIAYPNADAFDIGYYFSAIIPAIITPAIIYIFRKTQLKLARSNQKLEEYSNELTALNQRLQLYADSLEEAHIYREALFGVIAHDFRSPLSSLTGVLNSVELFLDMPERLPEIFSSLEKQNNTLLEMIDSLLIWSKKQLSGNTALTLEALPLRNVMTPITDLYAQIIIDKQVTIINQLSEKQCVYAEAVSLSLICRNLISNALKFIEPKTGVITLSMEHGTKFDRILIADNGI